MFFKSFLDFVFPPRCVVCREFVDLPHSLCMTCRERWPQLREAGCVVCAEAFVSGPSHLCADCLQDPPGFERIYAAGLYEGNLHDLVVRLKYQGEERLAVFLGKRMADALSEEERFDWILPVPLHISRLRERGFNQAVLLGRTLGRSKRIPMAVDCLKKVRSTPPQATLKKEERRKNLRGVFALQDAGRFKGKSILLVDDVATTGETLREAARVLKRAGAGRVVAVVAARAI